jgi:hypothetical protein
LTHGIERRGFFVVEAHREHFHIAPEEFV